VPAQDGAAASLGAIEFMGGRRLFKAMPQSRTEIHAALVQGLPCSLLLHLIDHLSALSLDEIADALGIGLETVNTYIRRIYEKLHVHSRAQAVAVLTNQPLKETDRS